MSRYTSPVTVTRLLLPTPAPNLHLGAVDRPLPGAAAGEAHGEAYLPWCPLPLIKLECPVLDQGKRRSILCGLEKGLCESSDQFRAAKM